MLFPYAIWESYEIRRVKTRSFVEDGTSTWW